MKNYRFDTKLDVLLTSYCRKIISLTNMEIHKGNNLIYVLDTIQSSMQPEIYFLRPILLFIIILGIIVPLLWIHIALFLVAVLILGILIFFYSRKAYCTYNQHMTQILAELSNLILFASYYFERHENILSFIDLYYKIAGAAMKQELDRLIEDIASNGQEKAFYNMKKHLQHKEIQSVIDGFIVEPQSRQNYFKTLNFQRSQKRLNEQRKYFCKKLLMKNIYFFIMLSLWGFFLCYFFNVFLLF